MREKLIKLLYYASCESELEGKPGSCLYRKHGRCGEVERLDYCAVQHLADHLIANGVTIQQWIPVTERMPEEHESIVPGFGMVSGPVLVTWMDPNSKEPYPRNSFVREGITRNGEFTLSHINGDLIPVAWMPQPKPYDLTKEVE